MRQPAFAFREVVVHGPLERANAAHLEAVIRDELAGTFFTMDLDRARARARARAVGAQRRAAPAMAAAARGDDRGARAARALERRGARQHAGEVFVADYDGELPQFDGPDGSAAEVAARYPRMERGARAAGARARGHPAVAARRLAARRRGAPAAARDRAGARRAGGAARALRRRATAARSARSRAPARGSSTSTCAIATDSRRACRDSAERAPKKAAA